MQRQDKVFFVLFHQEVFDIFFNEVGGQDGPAFADGKEECR